MFVGVREGPDVPRGLRVAAAVSWRLLAVAALQVWRRRWLAAGIAAVSSGALYSVYWFTDELPEELTAYTPHLVTLVVLAAAAQRLRPPAANGLQYRRGVD